MLLRLLIFSLLCHSAVFSQTLNKEETPGNYIKIFWLDNHNVVLNEAYLKTISNQQRAAIAYNVIHADSGCQWDGEKAKDESNLKCKLLSALNLGYQCSEKHLSFLKKWFKNDTEILEQLKSCYKIESSSQSGAKLIELKMATAKNAITIIYTASIYIADEKIQWTEESKYSFIKDEIKQIGRENIKVNFYKN